MKYMRKIQYLVIMLSTVAIMVPMKYGQAQLGGQDLVPSCAPICDWCDVFELLQNVFNTAAIIIVPLIMVFIFYILFPLG